MVAHFQAAKFGFAFAVDKKRGVKAQHIRLKIAFFESVVVEDLEPRACCNPDVTVVANDIRQNGCGVLIQSEGAANKFSHSAFFVLF